MWRSNSFGNYSINNPPYNMLQQFKTQKKNHTKNSRTSDEIKDKFINYKHIPFSKRIRLSINENIKERDIETILATRRDIITKTRHCCSICGAWRGKKGHSLNLRVIECRPERDRFVKVGVRHISNDCWFKREKVSERERNWEYTNRICQECFTFSRWQKKFGCVMKELRPSFESPIEGCLWGWKADYLKIANLKSDPLYFTGWEHSWADWTNPAYFSTRGSADLVVSDDVYKMTPNAYYNFVKSISMGSRFDFCKGGFGKDYFIPQGDYKPAEQKNDWIMWSAVRCPEDWFRAPTLYWRTRGKKKPDYERYKKAVDIIEKAFFDTNTPIGKSYFNRLIKDSGLDEFYDE